MAKAVSDTTLEIVRLDRSHVDGLADMLAALSAADETDAFSPHPIDHAYLATLYDHARNDLYYVGTFARQVVAYGLLRGWDEGFEVPSLGIAVHPDFRRRRLSEMLMHFLHAAARLRGSKRVRLRVLSTNASAIRLYERVGYQFDPTGDVNRNGRRLLIAYKDLGN